MVTDTTPADITTSGVDLAARRVSQIEVLHDRLIPGTDGRIDHVIVANDAITLVRTSTMRGRIRTSGNNVHIGGASASVVVHGLEARVDMVRHLVGGFCQVQGALFLTRGRTTPQKVGSVLIGEDKQLIEILKQNHCSVADNLDLPRFAAEVGGMLLPATTFAAVSA